MQLLDEVQANPGMVPLEEQLPEVHVKEVLASVTQPEPVQL